MRAEIDPAFTVIFRDESRGCLALHKVGTIERIDQEVAVGPGTKQRGFRQGLDHPPPGFVAGGAVGDDLGDHRIIKGRHFAAGFNPAVDPRQAGGLPQMDRSGAGQEIIRRILGIEPDFHCMAGHRDVLLFETQ